MPEKLTAPKSAKPDWSWVRAQFPALRRWTYLNTATFGQLPRAAVQAAAQHFRHRDALACTDFVSWFDHMDAVRAAAARLAGAAPSDIAFLPNASSALALLTNGIDWRPGDRIVTLEGEFPNNLYAASAFASRGIAAVETTWDRLPDFLAPPTRLLLLSTVNYSTGFRPPVADIAPLLARRRILLYLDGTQSAGALRTDLRLLQPALYAVDCYKWMLCPNGAAFAVIPPETRSWLRPLAIGWRSDRAWRDVQNLHHGAPRFSDSAEKYEGGMLPFALLYAMQASISLMLELGPAAIERRVLSLAARTRRMLVSLGAQVPHAGSGIVAARFPTLDAPRAAAALAARRIAVAARHGFLRVSPHFYNNEADLDVLEQALRRLL